MHCEAIALDRNGRNRHAVGQKEPDRSAAEEHEERRAGSRSEQQEDEAQELRRTLRPERKLPEEHAGRETERREGAAAPARRGHPDQPQREDEKSARQHELRHPDRDAERDLSPRLALQAHHLDGSPRQEGRGGGSDRAGEDRRRLPPAPLGEERRRGDSEELSFPRGVGRAEETEPEGQVLQDRQSSRNASASHLPEDELARDEQRHHRERHDGDGLFGALQKSQWPAPPLTAGRARYFAIAVSAASRISVGTRPSRASTAKRWASSCQLFCCSAVISTTDRPR